MDEHDRDLLRHQLAVAVAARLQPGWSAEDEAAYQQLLARESELRERNGTSAPEPRRPRLPSWRRRAVPSGAFERKDVEHRYSIAVTAPPTVVTARCSCGWRSDPAESAALAGAAWDVHLADVTTGSFSR